MEFTVFTVNENTEKAILFSSFPWLELNVIDSRILESILDSLKLVGRNEFLLSLQQFCTIFYDYPVQVFLHRPFILEALLDHIVVHDVSDNWRLQECIYDLISFFNTRLLNSLSSPDLKNLSNYTPKSSGDETQYKTLTVIEWSCKIISKCDFTSGHLRVMKSILDVIRQAFKILRSCLRVEILWIEDFELYSYNEKEIKLISLTKSTLKRSLKSACKSVIQNYYSLESCPESEKSRKWTHIQSITRVIIDWINLFSPASNYDVYGLEENECFRLLLSDACFLLENSENYFTIQHLVDKLDSELFNGVVAVNEAAQVLNSTKKLIQISTSETREFLDLASGSLCLFFVHKSSIVIEKIMRGLSKILALNIEKKCDKDKTSQENSEELRKISQKPLENSKKPRKSSENVESLPQVCGKQCERAIKLSSIEEIKATQILLQMLSYEDRTVRKMCYRSLKNLVEKSIGISQVNCTSKSASRKILFICHPSVLNHLIFSCSHQESCISKASREILLLLLCSEELMDKFVLENVKIVLTKCLLNLQLLVDSKTLLGKTIFELPYQLLKIDHQDSVLLRFKFYLKCLLHQDENVRRDALKSCMAVQVLESSNLISVAPSVRNFEKFANMFVFDDSRGSLIHERNSNLKSDREDLRRVLHMMTSSDEATLEHAWTQLTFILRNVQVHEDLELTWPVLETVNSFEEMLKVNQITGFSVCQVPLAVEVFKLRIIFCRDSRLILRSCEKFFRLIFRACLIFHSNESVVLNVSAIFSFLLNDENFLQFYYYKNEEKISKNINAESKSSRNLLEKVPKFVSFPFSVSKCLFIPFDHGNYEFTTELKFPKGITLLKNMILDRKCPVKPLKFLKIVWSGINATDYRQLLTDFDFASIFSPDFILTNSECIALKSCLSLAHAGKLLDNVYNCSTHEELKHNVTVLRILLGIIESKPEKLRLFLQIDGWFESLGRFYLKSPTNAMDKQLLYHVILILGEIIGTLTRVIKNFSPDCVFCPVIESLFNEFSSENSSLSLVLKSSSHKTNSSADLAHIQNFQLFKSIMTLVSSMIDLSERWNCNCKSKTFQKSYFVRSISKVLTEILLKSVKKLDSNISILIPILDCLVSLFEKNPFSGENLLISNIVELLIHFYEGRGRDDSIYLGRAVTVRSLLLVSLLLQENIDQKALKDVVNDYYDLPWLYSALNHSDGATNVAALKLTLALANTKSGTKILDHSADDIPGGVLSLVLSKVVNRGFGAPIRVTAAQIFSNLCYYASRQLRDCDRQSEGCETPFRSLCLLDTVTETIIIGREAFMALLNHFSILDYVNDMIWSLPCETVVENSRIVSGIVDLDEYISSMTSRWVSFDFIENFHVDYLVEECPEILESSITLLSQCLLVDGKNLLHLMLKNKLEKILTKKLSALHDIVLISNKWSCCIEAGFKLLRQMGLPYASDVQLTRVAINILKGNPSDRLKEECFRVLSCALLSGGWDAVYVLELIKQNAKDVFLSVIDFLQGSEKQNSTALKFIGVLCENGMKSVPDTYLNSLNELLDAPMVLYEEENRSTFGWEITHYVLQLMETKIGSKSIYDLSIDEPLPALLHSILECLKSLFYVSKTANDFAYFRLEILMKSLLFPIKKIKRKIIDSNMHINYNIMNKRELKNYVILSIYCLQVATNLISDYTSPTYILAQAENYASPLNIAEIIVPSLHFLWTPALRAFPFLEAMLNFLIACTSHIDVNSILTRTSMIPGAELSQVRTKFSFLSVISRDVIRVLTNERKVSSPDDGLRITRKLQACIKMLQILLALLFVLNFASGMEEMLLTLSRPSAISYNFILPGEKCSTKEGCGFFPTKLIHDAFDLLCNCARVHECSYVMVKEGTVKFVLEYLENCPDLASKLCQKLLKFLAILTVHKEARAAMLKFATWTEILLSLKKVEQSDKNVNAVFINIVSHSQAVKHALSNEYFMQKLISELATYGEVLKITAVKSNDFENEQEPSAGSGSLACHSCLVLIWCLAANNQRCKIICRKLNLLLHLKYFVERNFHTNIVLKILNGVFGTI